MLRYAMRTLGRSPVFTMVTVLSLGLALALNTTLFAIVDGLVHPYLPYAQPERAFVVFLTGGDRRRPISLADVSRAIREGLESAQSRATWTRIFALVEGGGQAQDGQAAAVSPNTFDLLGVRPEVGRGFSPAGPASIATQQAIISHALWNRFFHGASLKHRLKITVASATYDVIGVMPQGVHFPFGTDVWVPEAAIAGDTAVRHGGPLVVFRLKPGATRDQAQHELETIMGRLALEYGQVQPYFARMVALGPIQGDYRTYRYMLSIVALVLIIACANLGTMMLARGIARRRELAIRIALGASRRAIVSQVLTECSVIVVAGLSIGLLLMLWAIHVVPHMLTPYVPGLGDLRATPSWRVFGFAAAIAMAATLLAGAVPALRASGTNPVEPIKEGGTSTDRVRDRYNPLIIVEVALSTGLLMASGLFVLYSMRLAAFHFTFDAAHLLASGSLRVPADRMTDPDFPARFYDDLIERTRNLPHVVDAATTSTDKPDHGVVLAEEGKSGDRWMNSSGYTVVSPEYLRTLGIPVVQGRDFQPGDRAGSDGVVIVDEAGAARLFPDLPNPVGHMIKLGDEKSQVPWLYVIGVARATEYGPRKDIELPPEPSIYVLYPHDRERERELIVRGDGVGGYPGRQALALRVGREIQNAAPWLGGARLQPWLQSYDESRSHTGFLAATLATFGAFGLVLCAVGLYGVLAYAVARRLREFAIRTAFGATSRDVVGVVVHDTTVTVLAGIGAGAFLGLLALHGAFDTLFTIHYEFAIALVGAEALLVLAGVLGCIGPVRQAIRADPVDILRAS